MNGSEERNGPSGEEADNDIIMVKPRLNSQLTGSEVIETHHGSGSKEVPEKTKTDSQSYEDIIEEADEDLNEEVDEEQELTEDPQVDLKKTLKKKKKRNLYLIRLIRRKRLALKKTWGKKSGAGKTPCILVEKNCKYFGLLEKLPAPKKIQSWLDSMDGSYCTWEELQDHFEEESDGQNDGSSISIMKKKEPGRRTSTPPKKPLNVYLSKEEISSICQGSMSKLSFDQIITINQVDHKKNEVDTSSSTIGKHPLSSSSSSSGSSCSERSMLLSPELKKQQSKAKLQRPTVAVDATTEGLGLEVKESTTTRFGGIISKIFKRQSNNKVSPNDGLENEPVTSRVVVDNEGQKYKDKDMIEKGENDLKVMDKNIDDEKVQKQNAIEQNYIEDEEIQRLSLLLKSSNKKKTTERTIFSMQNDKIIGEKKKDEKSTSCGDYFHRFFSTFFDCCRKTSPISDIPEVPTIGNLNLNNANGPRFIPVRQFQTQRQNNFQQQRRNRSAVPRIYPLSASSPAGENFRLISRDQATRNEILAELQREVYIRNLAFGNRRQFTGPQQQAQVHSYRF